MDRFPQYRQIAILYVTPVFSEVDNNAFCPG